MKTIVNVLISSLAIFMLMSCSDTNQEVIPDRSKGLTEIQGEEIEQEVTKQFHEIGQGMDTFGRCNIDLMKRWLTVRPRGWMNGWMGCGSLRGVVQSEYTLQVR